MRESAPRGRAAKARAHAHLPRRHTICRSRLMVGLFARWVVWCLVCVCVFVFGGFWFCFFFVCFLFCLGGWG